MERQLDNLEKKFPSLRVNVVAARASWLSSPFAGGCDAIEKDIVDKAGKAGRKMLDELDAGAWAMAKEHATISTLAGAREFLQLVDDRAKGGIEVDMVRANLLWNYPQYQVAPEKEVVAGFVRKITHAPVAELEATLQVPMSWKAEDTAAKKELLSFRNQFAHGNVWMTVLVSPAIDGLGNSVTGLELFENYSEDGLRSEYEKLGIKLNSFSKTKVNGLPALMFTRTQTYEQLGQRALRAAEVIRVFKGNSMISLQINTLGPEGEAIAEARIKKYQPLFRMIGASLRVEEK
ncbi:MAG TPA: hypothetical protein VK956_00695 [Verrucomicrobium sp.]|nr:hypothetical protein [Verrucomicrobium sp.]